MSPQQLISRIYNKRINILILTSIILLYFFSFFQRIAVPGTIFNELQTDFAVSAAVVTSLGAIYLYMYAGTQVFTGILADRFGSARVLIIGGVLMAIGSICFPLCTSLTPLYLSRAVIGLGASLMFITMVKEISLLFSSRNFTLIMGIALFLGYSGGLVGTLPLERAVVAFGWRKSLFVIGLLCSLTLICTFIFLVKTKRTHDKGALSATAIKDVICNKAALPTLICASINFAIYFLLQASIGKKLLQDCCQFTSQSAAGFTFIMMLVIMISAFIFGFSSRLLGGNHRLIISISAGIMLFATVLMIISLTLHLANKWILLCYILFGCAAGTSPIYCASMRDLNPPESFGTSLGVLNGASYFAIAILSTFAGFILDMFDSQIAHASGITVYPIQAYVSILILCLILAIIAFYLSFFVAQSPSPVQDLTVLDETEMYCSKWNCRQRYNK